jgi:hypothetical protein
MSSLSTEPDGSEHTSFHALLPTNDESPTWNDESPTLNDESPTLFSSACGSPSDSKKVRSARRSAPPRLLACKCSPRRPTSPSRIPTGREALDEPLL